MNRHRKSEGDETMSEASEHLKRLQSQQPEVDKVTEILRRADVSDWLLSELRGRRAAPDK